MNKLKMLVTKETIISTGKSYSKSVLLFLGFAILLTSCAVMPLKYSIPQTIVMPHSDVMTNDFPTKKSVFTTFGTPTSKETYDNIENWYFKLSEVTNSNSIGLSTGVGRVSQDPMNPYLRPVDRTLVTQQQQINSVRTNSVTRETYVKFWFANDSVTKWETYGVNYERQIPNPQFDAEFARENEATRIKVSNRNKPIAFGSVVAVMLSSLLIANATAQ